MTKDPASLLYSSRDATPPLVRNIGASYFMSRVLATVECSLKDLKGSVVLNAFLQLKALYYCSAEASEVAGAQNY